VLQGAGAIYPFPEFWLSDNFLSKNFCLCVQNLNWKSPILGKFKDKIHFSSIHNFLCRKFVLSVSTSCLSPTFFITQRRCYLHRHFHPAAALCPAMTLRQNRTRYCGVDQSLALLIVALTPSLVWILRAVIRASRSVSVVLFCN